MSNLNKHEQAKNIAKKLSFWSGNLSIKLLMDRFNIKRSTASRVIIDLKEDGVIQNVTSSSFSSDILPESNIFDDLLNNVDMVSDLKGFIDIHTNPRVKKPPYDALVIRRVLQAMRDKKAIQIKYISMSKNKEQEKRWIQPLFVDFLLGKPYICGVHFDSVMYKSMTMSPSRILFAGDTKDSPGYEWKSDIALKTLKENLTEDQKKALRIEIGFQGDSLKVSNGFFFDVVYKEYFN